MTSQHDKAKRWQFSLRELVALMLIVALFLGYWRELLLRRDATSRLDAVLSRTPVVIVAPQTLERWSTRADISVLGGVFLPVSVDCSDVKFELLPATESTPIAVISAKHNLMEHGVHQFVGTFTQPLGLEPGAYVIRVRCFDGDVEIATGTTVIHTVTVGE